MPIRALRPEAGTSSAATRNRPDLTQNHFGTNPGPARQSLAGSRLVPGSGLVSCVPDGNLAGHCRAGFSGAKAEDRPRDPSR